MKLILHEKIKRDIMEMFPERGNLLVKDKFQYDRIKHFFECCSNEINRLINLENNKNNNSINDMDFFSELLEHVSIYIDNEDKDEYLKEIFEGNYQICVLKTIIPSINYDIKNNIVNYNLISGVFALKDTHSIDTNHIYSAEEIVSLSNQNVLRFLAVSEKYQEINSVQYVKLSNENKNKINLPLDIEMINRHNYRELISVYPYLFVLLRNKITFTMLSDLLLEYEELLTGKLNEEEDKCHKIIENCSERLENIKKLSKSIK